MLESFSLPLRPVLERPARPDTLPVEIAQINSQWGSFREVNEEILHNKMAEEREGLDVQKSEDEDNPNLAEQREQLYKRRAEIIQFAMQSHVETSFALNFLSVVLGKNDDSIPPFLRNSMPNNALNSEVVHPPPKPESAAKDISTVSRGWRLQNFQAGANKLLKAASRLEAEVASEVRYWDELLTIRDKGWQICRLPSRRHTMAVQLGFLQASPFYRDRGLAPLRRGEDGTLVLDKGLVLPGSRYVRVRVKQGSSISTSTKPSSAPISNDTDSIEHRILQARDSLFEEELFYELYREARAMASGGVTTHQNLLQIPITGDLEIMLDLVDANDADIHQTFSGPHSLLADGLAHSIRILLTFSHHQNLRRRTQIPPPLGPKKRPVPEHYLIRPALAYLQHVSHVRWIEEFLNDIFGVWRSCGLEEPPLKSNTFSKPPSQSLPSESTSPSEALLQRFVMPLHSVFSSGSFKVTMRTNLSAPPFTTFFDVSFTSSKFPDLKSPGHLSLKADVEASITHLFLLEIVSHISAQELPPLTSPPLTSPSAPSDPDKRSWLAVYPHMGELLLSSHDGNYKKMKVSLSRHGLSLSTFSIRNMDRVGRGPHERQVDSETHTWTSANDSNKQSMIDFVLAEAAFTPKS
ncbi:hypothetical protein N7495_010001 [Penicillium taxi]|uniref:uncharacterized protein n=1 Tax=Penicillium taxi TaxID=168475 RepID=UPI00254512DF|nr:uncharacterized protein N7495_010001 [Penicillium taxi]KAJ5885491.1 hypothetical protein N7495_010001 [Penicillium taxi]